MESIRVSAYADHCTDPYVWERYASEEDVLLSELLRRMKLWCTSVFLGLSGDEANASAVWVRQNETYSTGRYLRTHSGLVPNVREIEAYKAATTPKRSRKAS